MLFSQEKLNTFQTLCTPSLLLALDKCFGTIAYTITPEGATKFESLCFPLSSFRVPLFIQIRYM